MISFRKTYSCRHEKISPNQLAGYCPDCGEYVENRWYISRCKCCGYKQNTKLERDEVRTSTRYCRNCGCNSFIVEELETIDIVNIHYAVLLKHVKDKNKQNVVQTWLEKNSCNPMKLLPSY